MSINPRGAGTIRLTALIADTIATHGLQWAVAHYARGLAPWEMRVLFRSAYVRGVSQ